MSNGFLVLSPIGTVWMYMLFPSSNSNYNMQSIYSNPFPVIVSKEVYDHKLIAVNNVPYTNAPMALDTYVYVYLTFQFYDENGAPSAPGSLIPYPYLQWI